MKALLDGVKHGGNVCWVKCEGRYGGENFMVRS